jgi:hypothetical protein
MQLKSKCPKCGAVVRANESLLGKRVRCPTCKEQFELTLVQFSPSSPSLEHAPQAHETIAPGSSETSRSPDLYPPSPDARMPAELGKLGRFELKELLGQGAFGRVYKAYDPQLDRFVALKVPTFGLEDKHKVQRFIAEAKAAAKLRHPNIVPTYESGQFDGKYYIASQFVAGQPLSKRIKENLPDFREAAEWVRQLAEALAYAHREGIVHRDIKPDNIMLDEKGVPQIMDFGLAKRLNEDAAMTTDGSLLGTPAYMSPEQARGKQSEIGPSTDQYSLGVVLYELLTGKKPFEGALQSVIAQVIATEPPCPRALNKQIPRDLDAVCQKAMSKEVSQRYTSCVDTSEDLARWLRGDPTYARPIWLAERAVRWCRKNPVVSALSTTILVVLIIGFILVTIALIQVDQARKRADRNATLANENELEAKKQKKLAEENLDLANARKTDAESAQKQATAKAEELQQALSKLQTETSARVSAEKGKLAIEKATGGLEAITKQLASEQSSTFYADRIAKATEALNETRNPGLAASYLAQCPENERGWEWFYLKARIRADLEAGPHVVRSSPTLPLHHLEFSPDGKRVVGGAHVYESGLSKALKFPWNCVWDLSSSKSKLKGTVLNIWAETAGGGKHRGGRLCSFSRDSKQILTVNSTEATTANAVLWNYGNTWEFIQTFPPIQGFALACAQNARGEWILLTAETSPTHENFFFCRLPIIYHNLTTKRSHTFQSKFPTVNKLGFLAGARLRPADAYPEFVLITDPEIVRKTGSLSPQAKTTQASLYSLSPTFPDCLEDARAETLFFSRHSPGNVFIDKDSDWNFFLDTNGTDNLIFRAQESAGRAISMIVVKRFSSDLTAVAGDGIAFFDREGRRVFVFAERRGLEVFDPSSTLPTRPLLRVPVDNKREYDRKSEPVLAAAISPSGDQIALAIDESITFIDVSGSRD